MAIFNSQTFRAILILYCILALYELASLGLMRDIHKQALRLEEQDARYRPFARKLMEFADAFEEEQIIAFLNEYLA